MKNREIANRIAELHYPNEPNVIHDQKYRVVRMKTLADQVESELNLLTIPRVSDTLIAWEQFKKANWYESEAIDVEKMLMDKFQAIYGR